MSQLARRIALGTAVAAASVATGFQFQRWFTEQPKYRVVRSVADLEVRQYQPRIVATTVMADGDDTGDGFRVLAGYIFGGNSESERIAMTSPVESGGDPQRPEEGETIAMTSPVETGVEDGVRTMRFVMPSEYSMADLPAPSDPRVRLREVSGETVAAWRFAGRLRASEVEAKKQQAMRLAEEAGLEVTGPPRIAQYDPPWTLAWFRRNEVLIPVAR